MSGHNSPASRALSSVSLSPNNQRVSVEVTIKSDSPGIKTFLGQSSGEFLEKQLEEISFGGSATVENMKKNLLEAYATATVFGISKGLITPVPVRHISVKYNDDVHDINIASLQSMSDVLIEAFSRFSDNQVNVPAFKSLYRISDDEEVHQVKNADDLHTEFLYCVQTFNDELPKKQAAKFSHEKEKHISIKHANLRYTLEVSSIQSLEMLFDAVGKKIQVPQAIKLLYTMEDNDAVVVTEVKELRDGFLYYALTGNKELPKKETVRFTTLQELFEKWKTDQDLEEEDVQNIKDCFEKQKIKLKQLMGTGELAITDNELKDYGITQGGLRKAILAVIKSYLQ